jgi:peptide/nickel transport system ATP-binding protein
MRNEPLLEVNGLVTVFGTGAGETTAINNVSFILHRGETMGIVGESGSGKSVTSLTVMRLIPSPPGKVKAGEILLHGNDGGVINMVTAEEKQVRELRGNKVAMIFQEPMTSLNPVMKCGDQVMEALLLHKKMSKTEARARTVELFAEAQLPDPEGMLDRYPHQLSGGQKQRVMIAMAMSCEPDVLIADEPTTALDVTVQKTILELMVSLQKKYGLGIMFITHDLGVIAELADTVLVMYKGRIVENAPVRQLFSNPQHPYTKSLLACRPPLSARPRRLPVVNDFMTVDESGNFSEKIHSSVQASVISGEERKLQHAELYNRQKLIEIKDLRTWFTAKTNVFGKPLSFIKAVDDVSFDIYEGETLGLVGESGCGKSTLGRSIIRLAPSSGGEVKYKGVNLLSLSEKEFLPYRKKMQIIFQDPYSSLNPRITVGRSIQEPMTVHGLWANEGARREKVMELLIKVGLDRSHYSRYPHEFSGGQRQRVCIARALAVQPEFIICDESVSALDVSVQAQVLNLLNDLREEFRFTCIFISHDLGVVKYMSDRMIVMQRGKIVEMGDPDDIYREPSNEYTKKLIDSIPDGSVENIERVITRRSSGH